MARIAVIHKLNNVDFPSSWLGFLLSYWMPVFASSSEKHTCINYQPSKGRLIIWNSCIMEEGFIFTRIGFIYLLLLIYLLFIYYFTGFTYIQFVFTRSSFTVNAMVSWLRPPFPTCREGQLTTSNLSGNCSPAKRYALSKFIPLPQWHLNNRLR